MRENGPEPIIVQIKESLRLSDELDARLNQLEAVHNQSGLAVKKWYAGNKLLVMLSLPSSFTEQQAVAVITSLQQSPAVEKVPLPAPFCKIRAPCHGRNGVSCRSAEDPAWHSSV